MRTKQAAPEAERIDPEARSPLFEYVRYTEFKRILGQIALSLDKEGYNSITVLSELPEEGKTFFASAIALGYSLLLERRVLVVNTASHAQYRSLLHQRVFQNGTWSGGTAGPARGGPPSPPPDAAAGAAGSDPLRLGIDLISPFDDGASDLPVSSDFQLGKYIESLKNNYDLVIFDTCALSANNKNNMDPVVIARQSDTAILLTSWRSMDPGILSRARERLKHWNIRLMGTIFNSGVKAEK